MKTNRSIKLFLHHVQMTLADKTYKCYKNRLSSIILRVGDKKVSKLKSNLILEFIDELTQKNAPDSVRATIVALNQWQKFAIERGHIHKEIFSKIKKPSGKIRERIPTRKEQAIVLKLSDMAFADLYRCLIYTGARPNELTNAKISDYDRDSSMIVLKQHKTARKSGKVRKIPVGRRMKRILDRQIGTRIEGYIFLNSKNRRWTSETASHKYKQYRDIAGLSKDLVLYSTRHGFGTYVCEKKGIYIAKELMGHETIETTQRYAHFDKQKLVGIQDELF